jgi:hypothetical protein
MRYFLCRNERKVALLTRKFRGIHELNQTRMFFFYCCQHGVFEMEFFLNYITQLPMGLLGFIMDLSFRRQYGPGVDSASLPVVSPGVGKGRRCEGLTKFRPSFTDYLAILGAPNL